MNEKQYAILADEEGAFIGTIEEVIEWMCDFNVPIFSCQIWELGDKCQLKFEVEKMDKGEDE